jgi:DNA helicase-2/ATP-dependent DNA helicase PcrA
MASGEKLQGGGLSKRAAQKAETFAKSLLELGALARRPEDNALPLEGKGIRALSAHDAVALAIERSGVADRLEAEGTQESENRLENLNQLLSAAAQYVRDAKAEGEPTDAQGFLEAASLMSDGDGTRVDDSAESVTLMTLHAAKGLEFGVVFLVGMEENGFPHGRALGEDADPSELEEERRLAYVGMTRAKRELLLTWALRRMVRGEYKRRSPSRFLRELPQGEVRGDVPGQNRSSPSPARNTAEVRASALNAVRKRTGHSFGLHETGDEPAPENDDVQVELDPAYAAPIEAAADLQSGTRVVHQTFGQGRVVGLRGDGRMLRALVRFDQERQPRVILARHLGRLSG